MVRVSTTFALATAPAATQGEDPDANTTWITWSFPDKRSQSPTRLGPQDVAVRLVRTVVQVQQEAGPHEALWDGTDDNGARSPAGVFFYRLQAGDRSNERTLVVIQRSGIGRGRGGPTSWGSRPSLRGLGKPALAVRTLTNPRRTRTQNGWERPAADVPAGRLNPVD